MFTKISKTLESVIARVTFDATKANLRGALKDILILEILREEGSLAYQILSHRLKDWQLFQARLRIENATTAIAAMGSDEPEQFFVKLSDELSSTIVGVRSVSTAHALYAVVADQKSITSRVLGMYGVTPEMIASDITAYTGSNFLASLKQDLNNMERQSPLTTRAEPQTEPKSSPKLLDKFGVDLTEQARQGAIDPVIGRSEEIDRVIQILSRRKKNNPILVGEAGVGKSAIVEGLALKIVSNSVPLTIKNKRVISLDISALIAGTKFRGEFEERMQQIIEEIRSTKDVLIFIDETHTIVGAGATQGSLDTANILKPALARGEIHMIGATTLDEYRTCIESDSALERRFQKVLIEPTTKEQTLEILRRIAPNYEQHHGVKYTEGALSAAVEMADRYITDRHFPDKAIDIIDEAGARANINHSQPPARIEELEMELATAHDLREAAVHNMEYDQASYARLREMSLESELNTQRSKWNQTLRESIATIDKEHIAQVITASTGIPADRLSGNERERLRGLRSHLKSRVIGQEAAVECVTSSILRSRAGMKDEKRPIGVFMFVGPTGVGKTLLAKELSQYLFDEQKGLIRIDMSEYGEKHNAARLIGSPPGYVGYGEGGQLTEAVRRNPYSVVLFDEIEKAHPDVFNLMLQIFDEGHLTDGAGRKVDFRNTVIILTSNVGSQKRAKQLPAVGFNTPSKELIDSHKPVDNYRNSLEGRFAPEFLNRIDDVVIFNSLSIKDIEKIIDLELEKLTQRAKRLGYTIRITPAARKKLAELGFESRYGARALKRTIVEMVETPLTALIIECGVDEGDTIVVNSGRKNGVSLRVA